jgi:hypothetical protein
MGFDEVTWKMKDDKGKPTIDLTVWPDKTDERVYGAGGSDV